MITDPAEMMAQKIANSPTGRRCHTCLSHVQVYRIDGNPLVLDAWPTENGTYSIRADCESVYWTETALNRYAVHVCSEGGTGRHTMKPMKDEIEKIIDEELDDERFVYESGDAKRAADKIMALIEERFTTTDSDTSLSEVPLFTQD